MDVARVYFSQRSAGMKEIMDSMYVKRDDVYTQMQLS